MNRTIEIIESYFSKFACSKIYYIQTINRKYLNMRYAMHDIYQYSQIYFCLISLRRKKRHYIFVCILLLFLLTSYYNI